MTSLGAYQAEDFFAYFGHAYFLHPTENKPCMINNVSPGGTCSVVGSSGQKLVPLDYRDLPFELFRSHPALGYRHLEKGKYLYYVTKAAQRQRGKGLRDNTVIVYTCPELNVLCTNIGVANDYQQQACLCPDIVEAIFSPNYASLREAVTMLRGSESVLGVALSNTLAVTLLLNTKKPFVILFKENRAAYSADGIRWVAAHEEYKSLLSRTLPGIQWENT